MVSVAMAPQLFGKPSELFDRRVSAASHPAPLEAIGSLGSQARVALYRTTSDRIAPTGTAVTSSIGLAAWRPIPRRSRGRNFATLLVFSARPETAALVPLQACLDPCTAACYRCSAKTTGAISPEFQ